MSDTQRDKTETELWPRSITELLEALVSYSLLSFSGGITQSSLTHQPIC